MIPRMGRKGRNRCHASLNRKARFAAGLFTHSIMIGGVRRFALDQLQDAAKMPSARDMRPVSPLGDLPVRRRESQLGVKDGPILSQTRSRSKGPLSDQGADAPNSRGQCRS
jgi:hypothetical protein